MRLNIVSCLLALFLFIYNWCSASSIAAANINSDEYLTGYVQGLFTHNYQLSYEAVRVKQGIIIIDE